MSKSKKSAHRIKDDLRSVRLCKDPTDRDEVSAVRIKGGEAVEIISDTPFYGFNDKEYIEIRWNYKTGYVPKEAVV